MGSFVLVFVCWLDLMLRRGVLSTSRAFRFRSSGKQGLVDHIRRQKLFTARASPNVEDDSEPFQGNIWLNSNEAEKRRSSLLEEFDSFFEQWPNVDGMAGKSNREVVKSDADGDIETDEASLFITEAEQLDQTQIPDTSRSLKLYFQARADFHRRQMQVFQAAAAQLPDQS